MKERGYWKGIPGWWIYDPYGIDGRRFVSTDYGWTKLGNRMREDIRFCEYQLEGCFGRGTDPHHIYGRGAGGAWRDDRFCKLACRWCHEKTAILPRPISSKWGQLQNSGPN